MKKNESIIKNIASFSLLSFNKLSQRIKVELVKRNMTQRQLARQLGLSYRQLNGYLNNQSHSIKTEIKLLEWLNG